MSIRLVPAIILAIAIILAPLLWIFVPMLLPSSTKMSLGGGGQSADLSGVIIENLEQEGQIFTLQSEISDLKSQLEEALARISRLEASRGSQAGPTGQPDGPSGPGVAAATYTQVVLIFDRTNVNRGLSVAGPSFLVELLGKPRDSLSDDCEPMTNTALKNQLVTEQVGPVKVTMMRPAIESLKRVFEEIRATDPELHDLINTAGALCVRQIRGTSGRFSNHAFGLAVDLNINGVLDNFTDGKTQMGLTIMADFFHAEGWIWGAGFRREDSMHFEVSREKLLEWRAAGVI